VSQKPSALVSPADEIGILGACLNGGSDSTAEVLSLVGLGMILDERVRDSLSVLSGMIAEGKPVDIVNMGRQWLTAFPNIPAPFAFWSEAMDSCPSAASAEYFAKGVREAFQRRKLSAMCQEVSVGASDHSVSLDSLAGRVEAAMAISEPSQPKPQTSREVARDFVDDLQRRVELQGRLSGVTTGFHRLDWMTDGMQQGEMWVIGARPSIGKTAVAVNMLEACCINGGVPSMFASHEMNNKGLMRRLIASVARIELGDLKGGRMDEGKQRRLLSAVSKITAAPVQWLQLTRGESVDVLCAQVRMAVRRYGIRVVFVDYLQKVPAAKTNDKRTYEVAEVSGKLKSIADSTGVTLVALAQVNRDSEKEKPRPPKISELADCGQIERDADMIALLHRDRMERDGDAMLIVAKQRDGECGVVNLSYSGAFCRFEERQRERPE
jgi:replicative DNA helicase